MKHQAFGIRRVAEDPRDGQLQGHRIDIADDDDAVADFDVVIFGDFPADRAGSSPRLKRRQLIMAGICPVFADA